MSTLKALLIAIGLCCCGAGVLAIEQAPPPKPPEDISAEIAAVLMSGSWHIGEISVAGLHFHYPSLYAVSDN